MHNTHTQSRCNLTSSYAIFFLYFFFFFFPSLVCAAVFSFYFFYFYFIRTAFVRKKLRRKQVAEWECLKSLFQLKIRHTRKSETEINPLDNGNSDSVRVVRFENKKEITSETTKNE